MKDKRPRTIHRIRQERNSDLIRRMLAGESLSSFDNRASWYPPRPMIKKDEREVARVYQNGSESLREHVRHRKVVALTALQDGPSGFDEAG